MTELLKGRKVDVSVAVCHSGTKDIIDIFDDMHQARAAAKRLGQDICYWWLAAEWINDDGDVNPACWGKTRGDALNRLRTVLNS